MYEDITDRKYAEEALREGEERFRRIMEQLPFSVQVLSPEGEILEINEAFCHLWGVGKEALKGYNLLKDKQLESLGLMPAIRRAFSGERENTPAVEYDAKSTVGKGNRKIVQGYFYPIRDPNGVIQHVILIHQDVTEQKKAEEEIRTLNKELEQRVQDRTLQLEAANKELEAFSYSVSHDLRAPLRAIDGFSHVLMEDYGEKLDQEGKEYLSRVRKGCQRMAHLIDDLLNLSRITRNEITRKTIDLSALAREIVAAQQAEEPHRQVKVVIAETVKVNADDNLMRIVLENLLGNAWKFTRKRPLAKIEFGCIEQEGEKVYFVRDNGAGFDMAYADKLFGAFQRIHTQEEYEGTGIGLAIVQRIIHRHGGRVWAQAQINQGATFFFTLA
jgi:PAS domain S-box-containing protein